MQNNTHSEKEILIYNAVTKLIKNGVKLHSVKVADIAKAAGIGKGTIYDYFTSKEEILSKALLYYMDNEIKEVLERLESVEGFKNKFYIILDMAEGNVNDNNSITELLLSNLGIEYVKELLENDMKELEASEKILKENILELVKVGVEEGIINDQEDDEYAKTVLMSVVIGFCNYACCNKGRSSLELQKERAYKLLIKGLN